MNKKKINILVTSAGSYCAYNILKCLRNSKHYNLFTTDINKFSIDSCFSKKNFIIPNEKNEIKYIKKLLEISKKNFISIIIPTFDTELSVLKKNEKKFNDLDIKIIIGNNLLISLASNKLFLANWLESNNFNYIPSISLDKFRPKITKLNFPLILKPKFGWGSRNITIFDDLPKLISFLKNNKIILSDYLLQNCISNDFKEFTGTVTISKNKNILGSFCSERIIIKGDSRIIYVKKYKSLENQMIKIAKKINTSGPINFQFKVMDGKIFIFEINARFSTTSYVRSVAGYNEPLIVLKDFMFDKYKPKIKIKKLTALAYLDYQFIDNV